MIGRSGGFTLVESAIALALATLAITILLTAVAAQRDARQEQESLAQLEEIRAALIGFAAAHRRLPCPADPGANTGAETGCRGEDADDEVVAGAVPWHTLGVGEIDPWGHRLFYVVARRWTSGLPEIEAPITVKRRSVRAGAPELPGVLPTSAADVVAVVVSAGRNGHWAYTRTGARRAHASLDSSGDEGINAQASGSGKVFVAGAPRAGSSACNDQTGPALCEFDDLVVALTRGLLATRTGRTTSIEGR